jgi:hypothetical protein
MPVMHFSRSRACAAPLASSAANSIPLRTQSAVLRDPFIPSAFGTTPLAIINDKVIPQCLGATVSRCSLCAQCLRPHMHECADFRRHPGCGGVPDVAGGRPRPFRLGWSFLCWTTSWMFRSLRTVAYHPRVGAPRSGRGGRRFKSCHSDQ